MKKYIDRMIHAGSSIILLVSPLRRIVYARPQSDIGLRTAMIANTA